MKPILLAASCTLLLPALPAQVQSSSGPDLFEIYPQRTDVGPFPNGYYIFTRGGLGTGGGEILQEVPDGPLPDSFFRGVGGSNCTCTIGPYFEFHLRDLDPGTAETIYLVIHKNLTTGGPEPGGAGLIDRLGPLPVPPPTGVGGETVMTVATPLCFSVPCVGGFSFGIEVAPNALDPLDGIEVAGAPYYGTFSPPPFLGPADNPKSATTSYAWRGPPGGPFTKSSAYALKFATRTCNAPVLNMGNVMAPLNRAAAWTDSFGVGGMWPDTAGPRRDGIKARVQHLANANGPVVRGIGRASCVSGLFLVGPGLFSVAACTVLGPTG